MRPYKFKFGLDDPKRTLEHQNILFKKKSLKSIYEDWYNIFKSFTDGKSRYIELGSGGGFIKEVIPNIITSDVNEIPGIDKYFSASNIPFDDSSLSGIFMIDALHHFPEVEKFFGEAERVLKNGGRIVAIEPWNTFWSRFIYRKFHHELFDLNRDWTFPKKGPLSGSNMALPYIIFKRDFKYFENKFSGLKLRCINLHTPFSYLLTGGFSRKMFLPEFMIFYVRFFEKQIPFLRNKLAMFATIVIEKVEDLEDYEKK